MQLVSNIDQRNCKWWNTICVRKRLYSRWWL